MKNPLHPTTYDQLHGQEEVSDYILCLLVMLLQPAAESQYFTENTPFSVYKLLIFQQFIENDYFKINGGALGSIKIQFQLCYRIGISIMISYDRKNGPKFFYF